MDHNSLRHGQPDGSDNGVDDNASGTAGLVALAKTFSRPGARPRRSVIFVATTGQAKGFVGSMIFERILALQMEGATVEYGPQGMVISRTFGNQEAPAKHVIANINLDMIGRGADDSVVVNGLRDVDLAMPPAWVAAAHPELGLTVVDGGTVASSIPQSDHFAFTQKGIPGLYFHNGTHAHPQITDLTQAINPDQVARIVRLVFYIGQEIANGRRWPKWTAEGRRHYLENIDR